MRLDDGSRDRQADTDSPRLGRHERVEQALPHGLGNAGSAVLDTNDGSVARAPAGDFDPLRGRAFDGVDGIAQQIVDHLLELKLVYGRAETGLELGSNLDVPLVGCRQAELQRLSYGNVQRGRLDRIAGAAGERAQAPDDVRCAKRCLDRAVEGIANVAGMLSLRVLQERASAREIAADRGERLIEFMGERLGHRRHGVQARSLGQLGLHPARGRFGFLFLGDVEIEPDAAHRIAVGVVKGAAEGSDPARAASGSTIRYSLMRIRPSCRAWRPSASTRSASPGKICCAHSAAVRTGERSRGWPNISRLRGQ